MHNARGYECLCLLSSSRPRRCIHTHKHLNEHMYINILLSWDFLLCRIPLKNIVRLGNLARGLCLHFSAI